MKRLITIILILVLTVPGVSVAEHDPIVGGWYIMFDYHDMPYEDTSLTSGKNYMIYTLIFEEDGTVAGFSGESKQNIGFLGSGATYGTWQKDGDIYTVNIFGVGTSHPVISNDRLYIQTINVYYSMRRMFWANWEKDLITIH